MDALRAPIGGPPTRVGDGDYFVIFVLSFAVAQCLSSVFGTSFVSCEGFCIYYTIVHNCRTETPDLCLGGNSPPDCLHLFRPLRSELVLLPLLRFANARDFATCGSRRGLLALDPARAARPLTLARALPKSTSKVWRFRPSIASICHKQHMVEFYRESKVNYEGNALRDGILLTSDLQS